jgi:tetratricopeptide (TPR) repeat protein
MRRFLTVVLLWTSWGCATPRAQSGALEKYRQVQAAAPPVKQEPADPLLSDDGAGELSPLDDNDLGVADGLYALRLSQDPHDVRAYMARAMVRQRAGDVGGAARLYRACIRMARGFGPAYANYGALLMEAGRHREAAAILLEGAALAPDHAPIFANLAGVLAQLDRLDEAVAAAETAIELDDKDADLRRNHAAILYRAGKYDEAEKALKRALAEFPDDTADFLMRLSELYVARGNDAKALETLEKVNRISPDLPMPWLRRAALLGRHEDLDGTLGVLLDAMRQLPENEDIRGFFMAAMALRLQKDLAEGLDRIEKDNKDIDAYVQVARVHTLARDHRSALDVLTEGVAHNPDNGLLWSHIGLVETTLEREREALAAYHKAIALDHNLHVALNNCAYLLVTAKDPNLHDGEEALRLAGQALAAEPDNTSYLDTMAEVEFSRGDTARARKLIARALELQPNDERLEAQARRFEAAAQSTTGKRSGMRHPARPGEHPPAARPHGNP